MKRIVSMVFIFLLSFGGNFSLVEAAETERYFIVTAYYSPLAGQDYYMRGNLEAEKILQGNGTHGASGKPVFSGMLAAPKTYSFGTKIYLEGIGVGEVADRGGAIVQAGQRGHEYDRIDIWMGYGDEGLKRALAWGKRTVKWKIVSSETPTTFNYKDRVAPDWAVASLTPVQKEKTVFDVSLGIGSNGSDVKKLQAFLEENGMYAGEIDGIYNQEIINIIYSLQIENNILTSTNDYGAGYFWPKTRTLLKKMHTNGALENFVVSQALDIKEEEKALVTIEDTRVEEKVSQWELSEAEQILLDLENTKEKSVFSESFGKTEEEIAEILEVMRELEIYEGEENISYEEFISVVYDFQLENEIVKSEQELWAGYFWPQTRMVLFTQYENFINKKIAVEQEKQELEQQYKQIELYAQNKAQEEIESIGILQKGDVSAEVRNLQNTLKELWYFDYDDTAIFGDITKKAVADFQVEYELVENHSSEYAGIMWEKTLAKLGEVLYEVYYNEKIEDENLEVLVARL